jgi:hypothetical protein
MPTWDTSLFVLGFLLAQVLSLSDYYSVFWRECPLLVFSPGYIVNGGNIKLGVRGGDSHGW